MKLSDKIRSLRKANCMTQAELADKIGRSTTYVGLLERDKLIPEADIVGRLAEVFHRDVVELLVLIKR